MSDRRKRYFLSETNGAITTLCCRAFVDRVYTIYVYRYLVVQISTLSFVHTDDINKCYQRHVALSQVVDLRKHLLYYYIHYRHKIKGSLICSKYNIFITINQLIFSTIQGHS